MTTRHQLAIVAGILAAAATGIAADWNAWRGPAANGVSDEISWNPKTVANPAAVQWKANVGKGHSSLTVVGNRLYTLGSKLRAGEVTAEVVYCLDTTNGATVWEYAYPARHREYPGPGATPVVADGMVYTVGRDGLVHALRADDGAVVWRRDLVADGVATADYWGFNGSALVDGDRVILNAGGAGLALDRRTGKTVWSSGGAGNGHATPVPATIGGAKLVLIGTRTAVTAVHPATGDVAWSHPWRADRDPAVTESGLLLTGSQRGGGASLLDLGHNPPEEKWAARVLGGGFTTGVVLGTHAYGFVHRGNQHSLQCVDLATGQVAWSEDLGGWGALMAADDKLIIIDGDGDLVIVAAEPTAFKKLAERKIFAQIKRYETYPEGDPEACWTAPVLADGRVYLRTSFGQLACVDLRG